ncbi:ATP-binding protein [Sediminitomix flava]|uniref:histidine kinase n=1 Tax=Sediminitomix flava TaxID=379075 RepID=A0A315ZE28_SEDFL|nr:tetratricopeptide repeat-containing sensor histidine kinase [Sediminitomix flava]PWJ43791.1 tetratricopeptide repeat protein [Sediminitomix flava]
MNSIRRSILLLIYSILPILFLPTANAHNFDIDSLQQSLTEYEVSDTTYILTLTRLAKQYRRIQLDSAEAYAHKAYTLAEEHDYTYGKAEAIFTLGTIRLRQNRWDDCRNTLEVAIKLFQELNRPLDIGSCMANMAVTYEKEGLNKKCMSIYKQIQPLYEQADDKYRLGILYYNMAVNFEHQSMFDSSTVYFYKSLKVCEEIDDKDGMAWAYKSISQTYSKQNNLEKALFYVKKALEVREELEDNYGLGQVYLTYGQVYSDAHKYDSALVFMDKAVKLYRNGKFNRSEALALQHTGEIYEELELFDKALELYYSAKEIFDFIQEKNETAIILHKLADIYYKTQKYELADSLLHKSLILAQQNGQASIVQTNYKTLYQLDSIRGDYLSSFNHYKAFSQINDSINSVKKDKQLKELQIKYETEKKEEELVEKNKEIEIANTKFWISIIGIFIILLFTAVILRAHFRERQAKKLLKQRKEEIFRQKEEIEVQAEELKITNEHLKELDELKEALSAMLIHDLKNPLNSIIGLTNEAQFSSSVRPQLNQAGKSMLNIVMNLLELQKLETASTELKIEKVNLRNLFLDAYQEVSLLISEKQIQINCSFNEDVIVKADRELIFRVFINLLTNAIKYTEQNGEINIQHSECTRDRKDNIRRVRISIIDNGIGIPKDQQAYIFDKYRSYKEKKLGKTKSTGLGLAFCKLAIEAHEEMIGVESTEGEGASFFFSLPCGKEINENVCYTDSDLDEEIETIKITSQITFSFTEEEKAILSPVCEALSNHEVFEVSAVKGILNSVHHKSNDNIKAWINEVENTLYSCNTSLYESLININVTTN